MRDRAAAAVVVADRVQHQPLAVVEADAAATSSATRSALPSSVNETPSGWVISSGLRSSRSRWPGTRRGHVLAHRRAARRRGACPRSRAAPSVEVDDEVQPGDRVRVRVGALLGCGTRRRPSRAGGRGSGSGTQVRAVGPDVDQHPVHVGDPARARAPRSRAGRARSASSHSWNSSTVMFGWLAGLVLPGDDAVLAERDDAPCRPAPSSRFQQITIASRRIGSPARSRGPSLRRLAQLDRGEAPALADAVVAAQDRRGRRISSADSGSSGCGVPPC